MGEDREKNRLARGLVRRVACALARPSAKPGLIRLYWTSIILA
jgi:hypothetical protein